MPTAQYEFSDTTLLHSRSVANRARAQALIAAFRTAGKLLRKLPGRNIRLTANPQAVAAAA